MSVKAKTTPIFVWRIIVVTAFLVGLFGMLILRLIQRLIKNKLILIWLKLKLKH